MQYSKPKLQIYHDKAAPCFRPFWIGCLLFRPSYRFHL